VKLARRFGLILIAFLVVLLAIKALIRIDRDLGLFEVDMRRDHRVMASVLIPALISAWRHDGEERALRLLETANQRVDDVAIRFVWLDDLPSERPPDLAIERLAQLGGIEGDPIVHRGDGVLFTYVPVDVPGEQRGILVLSESLEEEREFALATIARSVIISGALVLLWSLVSWWLGRRMIGRLVDQMIAKARRVGAGDFSGDIVAAGTDELSELARELNAMSGRLASETEAHRRSDEELRHAERLSTVGKLASGVAHELGTPLNVASARAKMIEDRPVSQPEAIAENARIIRGQCDRMAAIIRQLLDFARRKEPSNRAPIDLGGLVKQTVKLLDPLTWKKKVAVDQDLPSQPVLVRADPILLQQVLTNLVVNGIHAMPNGGKVTIGVEAEDSAPRTRDRQLGPYASIFVRDQGTGMNEEVMKHVFEPFFTTKGIGEGTGLGLSVAYGIVQEHGGWIDVESRVGQGSCFRVHLPKADA
jgi:two-component system, NtrC family, sensor kinase